MRDMAAKGRNPQNSKGPIARAKLKAAIAQRLLDPEYRAKLRKTECPHGHRYGPESYVRQDGSRVCRPCALERNRQAYRRRKAA